jgi:ubiquitin-conjugating enzyme E2 Z
MNDKPFHNEPGYEQASNSADVMNYNACIRHETLRIAVIEMINPISTTSLQVPPQLRQVIRGLFLSFLESYQITCQQYMCDDGSTMIDPFGESRGKFCYGLLLNRINELAVEIESMDISTDSNENVSKICESKGDDDIES